MPQGKVKWFNNAKGYGFIIDESGGDELFVHYSYIHADGYKTLKAGQHVNFIIQESPNGRHAIQVKSEDNQHHQSKASVETRNKDNDDLALQSPAIPEQNSIHILNQHS